MATAVDQDSDGDGWLLIDSDNPAYSSGDDAGVLALSSACTTPGCYSDDDDKSLRVVIASSTRRCDRSPSTGVLALSSACTTPDCCSDDDDDDESLGVAIVNSSATRLRRRCSRSPSPPIPCPDDDDDYYVDGLDGFALKDDYDEDGNQQPPPPAESRPLSGLFHSRIDGGGVDYAAFDPVPGSRDRKVLVPDPAFSACREEVTVLASSGGLVCLHARATGVYIVANPAAYKHVRLPRHSCDHHVYGDPAVVITFEDAHPCCADHRGHYHVVVAFPLEGGVYAYESFSSRTWDWTAGAEVSAVEHVVTTSGVGALGRAFWRTALGYFLSYDPRSGVADLIPAPLEVLQWPSWELGEMDGTLAVTCMDERVNEVVVIKFGRCPELEYDRHGARDVATVQWTLATHFEGGCMRNRQGVALLRSQGHEVVMWCPVLEIAVAMDNEGRTTRTIGPLNDRRYYSDFIPYVASYTGVTRIQAGAGCTFSADNSDDEA